MHLFLKQKWNQDPNQKHPSCKKVVAKTWKDCDEKYVKSKGGSQGLCRNVVDSMITSKILIILTQATFGHNLSYSYSVFGWDLILTPAQRYSKDHWSNENTMKDYIHKIILLYIPLKPYFKDIYCVITLILHTVKVLGNYNLITMC